MWCPLDFTPPTEEVISKTLSEPLKSFISSVKATPSCWNHWPSLSKPLRHPNVVQNFCSTSVQRWELTMSDPSLSSLNQNGLMIPCFDIATQAVHLMECIGPCRNLLEELSPRRCCFLSSHGLRGGNVFHPRTTNHSGNQGSHQSCYRTNDTEPHTSPCQLE